MAEGIDVYTAYQNVTDWAAVRRSGREFCYVKVSDGASVRGTNGYGPAGRAAGVAMGAYHFAQAGDPVRQANLLVDQAAANGLLDLAPCLDAEAPGTMSAAFCIPFVRQVVQRGHRPCLYASNSTMAAIGSTVKAAVPSTYLWVARYKTTGSTEKLRPSVPWDVHQYSQAGRVPGIQASSVDLNDGVIPYDSARHNMSAPPAPSRKDLDDMAPTRLTPDVTRLDGTQVFHQNLGYWDHMDGQYIDMSVGYSGCEFNLIVKKADGGYVAGAGEMPTGSFGKVLKGTLRNDDLHWLGFPVGAQSFSLEIKPSTRDGLVCVNLYRDEKGK